MLDLANIIIGSAAPARPRGRSLDHVLKSQQGLNTLYVDRRSTGGSDGFAGAADPLHFRNCFVSNLDFRRFGVMSGWGVGGHVCVVG